MSIRACKVILMLFGLTLIFGLWLLLQDVTTTTRMAAVTLCAFYGAVAAWSARL